MQIPYVVIYRRFDGAVEREQAWAEAMDIDSAYDYFRQEMPAKQVWVDGAYRSATKNGSPNDVIGVEGAFTEAGIQRSIEQLSPMPGFESTVSELRQMQEPVRAVEPVRPGQAEDSSALTYGALALLAAKFLGFL